MCSLVSSLSRIHIVPDRDWITERRAGETSAELIRRHTGGVISTWIISVQWHASAPLDFALVWGVSPRIWPRSDICQIPYSPPRRPLPAVIKAVANLRRSLAAHTPGQCRNLDEGTLEASSLLGRSQPGFTGRLALERGLIQKGMLAPHLFLFDSKPLTLWYQQLWPITVGREKQDATSCPLFKYKCANVKRQTRIHAKNASLFFFFMRILILPISP